MTTPTAPTTLAEAIDAGVAAANADAGIAPTAQEEPGNDPSSEAGTDADAGDDQRDISALSGGTPDGAPDGKDGGDGETAAAGDVDAGKTDGEDEAGEDKGKDAAKPGDKVAKPGDKQPDALNDPIPAGLKEATTKRIQDLIKIGKDQTTRADQAETRFGTIVQRVRETGASPEQYGQALGYLSLVNSGRREDIVKALEFIEGERIALARMAGVALPGVSMVGDYPDIAAELRAGKITPERAEELAAQRAAQEFTSNRDKHNTQINEQRVAHQRAVQAAQSELNAEETRLMTADPDYKAKRPLILKLILPQIRSGRLRPTEWLPEFKRLYSVVPTPRKPSPSDAGRALAAARGGKPPARQPLRANQPAGGATPAPKTMAEAVELGIQMGTRG